MIFAKKKTSSQETSFCDKELSTWNLPILEVGTNVAVQDQYGNSGFQKWNSTGTVDEGYPTTNTKLKWMDLDVYVSIIQDSWNQSCCQSKANSKWRVQASNVSYLQPTQLSN